MIILFYKGQRVRLTEEGIRHLDNGELSGHQLVRFDKNCRGTVTGGLTDPEFVYVRVDGYSIRTKPRGYARSFWEAVDPTDDISRMALPTFRKGQRVQLTKEGIERLELHKDSQGIVAGTSKYLYVLVDGTTVSRQFDKSCWKGIEVPTIDGLRKMFIRINQDEARDGRTPVLFDNTDFYAEQIQNLYGVSNEEALRLAKELSK